MPVLAKYLSEEHWDLWIYCPREEHADLQYVLINNPLSCHPIQETSSFCEIYLVSFQKSSVRTSW